jgi:hypothetical protein
VIIYVGLEEEQFKVQRKQIYDAADYFKSLFGGSFMESSDGMAQFPEDDVDAWGLLVQWLDQNLQPFVTSPQHDGSDIKVLGKRVKFYCLAEAYGIDELMDNTIDTIRQGYKIRTHKPTLSIIEYTYRHTHEKSPLRSLMCCWFYLLTTNKDSSPNALSELGTECCDLLSNYFKLLQGDKSMPNRIKDQDISDLCIYYQHTLKGDKVCPNKKCSLENAEKILA